MTLRIVSRRDPHAFEVLPRRWVVERTFAWISKHRRATRDYERLPASHEAMILWAMIALMTRRLAQPAPLSSPLRVKPDRSKHVRDLLPGLSDARGRGARIHGHQARGRQPAVPGNGDLLLPGPAQLRAATGSRARDRAGPMAADPRPHPRQQGQGTTGHALGHPGDQHAARRQPR